LIREIIPKSNLSLITTLNNLLESEHNLELKSHIIRPLELTVLGFIAEAIKMYGFEESSILIDNFITRFLKNMVSYKRLSRIEIIKAISNLQETTNDDLTNAQKLITPIK
jgi:hypothetical protein